jgi:hypothetical protein
MLFLNGSISLQIKFYKAPLTNVRGQPVFRASSDYGQTLRGEAFGPMKMHKCPKSVLSAFTLEVEVHKTLPPIKRA